jgi:hypothetical protein
VSNADRDLVAALRAELAAVEPSRPCDVAAERAGLRGGSRRLDPVVARLEVRLARSGRGSERPRSDEGPTPEAFDWRARPEHCRMAWLRGRFLAAGSLSLAGGRTHLEFIVPPDEAPELAARLVDAGMPASWRIRRGRGVVTWKSGETIGLFLRRIGAGAALLELEARQVARALRGELNRVLNAESANLGRSVAAAGRQIAAIELLASDGRLAAQSFAVRSVADARREEPEATLSELAARLGSHRSSVQRALDRIERLAEWEASEPVMRGRSARGRGADPLA